MRMDKAWDNASMSQRRAWASATGFKRVENIAGVPFDDLLDEEKDALWDVFVHVHGRPIGMPVEVMPRKPAGLTKSAVQKILGKQ